MNKAINREVEVNSAEAKGNHTDPDVKSIVIAAPFLLAIYSIIPYVAFLAFISKRLNGRSAQDLVNIMGSEISIQLILDNAFRIGFAVALTGLVAGFLIVIIFRLANAILEREKSSINARCL